MPEREDQPTPERLDARTIEWGKLIETALTVPGSLGNTYNRFYRYSFFNQIALYMQGVEEPVGTYLRWKQMGRQVQKGSKAKAILRPIIRSDEDDEGQKVRRVAGFTWVNCLFTLSETKGEELPPVEIPDWSPDAAHAALDVHEMPFDQLNGNMQGFSEGRNYAINPIAVYPMKTMFHELGHIVLGHTTGEEGATEHHGVREFQAEATAYLVMNELEMLDHMDASASRAYIQGWMKDARPEDKDIRQVFGAVDKILQAGRAQPGSEVNLDESGGLAHSEP